MGAVAFFAGAAGVAAAPLQPVERLALLPLSGTNVHPGYLDAARDIFKDHLLATGRFALVTPAGDPGTSEIPTDQALARGRELNADLVVVVHLARLAGVGRLRLIVYRTGTGAMAHADSIAIAGGPDDLDPALKRLAVGLATGKPASKTADIETVTQKESDPLLQETANKSFGVRVGALVPLNRPADLGTEAVPGLGIYWLYDARRFLAEVALDFHGVEGATSFGIAIGGYYPFSKEDLTPYTGMSMAYSFTNLGGNGASGLRIEPAVGMIFGRTSTVQFRGEIGYFFNTFGERYEAFGSAVASTSTKRFAHGPEFSVGIGF